MAIEVIKCEETAFEGEYIIDTSAAYRGTCVYVSGWDATEGKPKVGLIASSANSKVAQGLVTQLPLVNTGSDTADSIDKLAKNSRVVVLKKGQFTVWGNAIEPTSFSAIYGTSDLGATGGTRSVGTAYWKNAYPCVDSGKEGSWVASAVAGGFGTDTSDWAGRVKIIDFIVDSTTTGRASYVKLDVDFNRILPPDL